MLVRFHEDQVLSMECVYEWFARFREGRKSVSDKTRQEDRQLPSVTKALRKISCYVSNKKKCLPTSVETRWRFHPLDRIVAYRECGLSFRHITRQIGRNPTTVMRIGNQCAAESHTEWHAGTPRPAIRNVLRAWAN
ncbi:hypothetical protein TNCV_3149971 [Trichonephila clavipes]|nr:hypothetical protein TNCV_3149971 [Trichonephila clavipes]